MKSYWFAQVDPTSNDRYPYKSQKRRRHIYPEERRRPREDGGRDWNDAATRRVNSHQPSEKGKEWIVSQSLQRECSSADTLMLDFWSPELE